MNAPDQLIRDAAHALSEMGEHLDAIGDFTSMTLLLLTAPDVEDDCPGLHRVMILIREHLHAVRERYGKADVAIHRLANP
jgi:hypothetical protein